MTGNNQIGPILAAILILVSTPLLAQAPAGAATSDSILALAANSRTKGAADAPVTIIEISDFQCPYCREFTRTTLPALDSTYIQTGKVRLVFLNYPLPMHTRAWVAAEAALCAGAQSAFWPMHDRLFEHQPEWSTADNPAVHFKQYAVEVGLDMEDFVACTTDDSVAAVILDDLMQAARSGIAATPTFIFNGKRVLSGALTLEQISAEIARSLDADP
ncbi:MAG TPA: thioredoxin domain-containing protein [Longimicrobiaceae bacterium]|nr:thioredoxin domain-containing protein [Longimicrobiaceae bacterium]